MDKLLALPRRAKQGLALFLDALLIGFALWGAMALRLESVLVWSTVSTLLWASTVVIVTLGAFWVSGLYRTVTRYFEPALWQKIAVIAFLSATWVGISAYALGLDIPRSTPIVYASFLIVLVGGARATVRTVAAQRPQQSKQPVLIYGTGDQALQLLAGLNQGAELRPVAFISTGQQEPGVILMGLPVISAYRVPHMVRHHQVERVLLALELEDERLRRDILQRLEPLPVRVQTLPSYSELLEGREQAGVLRDVSEDDLLGRDPVRPDCQLMGGAIEDRVVMVTGGGGSIGSELCRQIAILSPKALVIVDNNEYALYRISEELKGLANAPAVHAILADVRRRSRLQASMSAFGVNTVYHAAAYKHVPVVEDNVTEGVQNNVLGTWYCAEAALKAGVERFVLISTDKAVRPTNVMGASKRMAELVLQGLAQRAKTTRFDMVRFGNVLGSSGSVVPLFRRQIREGGPVTVTHPDIVRYFMTIPEASQLVLQASSMGRGGEVFLLDMGEPVRIDDLARRMIRLMGLRVSEDDDTEGDIAIEYSGLRPGEKLFEELLVGEDSEPTMHARIARAREHSLPWGQVKPLLEQISYACETGDCESVFEILQRAPLAFQPKSELTDAVWVGSERSIDSTKSDALEQLQSAKG